MLRRFESYCPELPVRKMALADIKRRLSWLRTFRGYTEGEAELAAWAADIITTMASAVIVFASYSGNWASLTASG